MSNQESFQPDERQVVSQPDQPSGGSAGPTNPAVSDRLRQFRPEDYEAARILAIRQDLHPLWLALLDPANAAARPALLEQLNQQFNSLTGQERYWPPEWIRETLTIGGKTKDQLKQEFAQGGYRFEDSAKLIVDYPSFILLHQPEHVTLVRLRVADLGFPQGATTDQIYERATTLGLDLCPAEVGIHYRLYHSSQPMREFIFVGMKQIGIGRSSRGIFGVYRDFYGQWLRKFDRARPEYRWQSSDNFLFRLRPLTPLKTGTSPNPSSP